MMINALKHKINMVFSNLDIPESGKIAEPYDWDRDCINNDFSEFLYKDAIPNKVLENHSKSLPALSPIAFILFLKSYLNYAIEHPESELAEHLIYRFSEIDSSDYWELRLKLMKNDMLSVVIDCLWYVRENLPKDNGYLIKMADNSISLLRVYLNHRI